MNQYLIPANSKNGQLIFNVLRPFDLGLLILGASLTLIFLFAFQGDSILLLFIKLLPIGISVFLIIPVANYHNVLVFLQEMYLFYMNQRKYQWKGWCASSEFKES